ncbi:MAG: hypothetical protein H6719_02230 [Sandaracinaceae bacterium]|nr:hypothetical protein [Sandaracinaceae bacterium]
MRAPHIVLLALGALTAAIAGCGASSRSSDRHAEAQNRTLDETRALMLIDEVLTEQGIPRNAAWVVPIRHGQELEVDVRLAQSHFGIEWMSPQDRADLGDAVPGPTTTGNLRIVPGFGDGHTEDQILILEHSTYDFVNERESVQAGRAGARETEERLRRDVLDFIHYVQGQGGL